MQLVFIPGNGNYEFGLFNKLNTEIVFTMKFLLNQEVFLRDSNVLKPQVYYKVSTIYDGFVNDQPRIHMEYQGNYTDKRGPKQQIEKKLRPKQFIRGFERIKGKANEGIVIDLIDKIPVISKKDQLNIVHKSIAENDYLSTSIDLRQQSQYSMVKDLHADKLNLVDRRYSTGEILNIQLEEFLTWLGWGIRFGQSPLFVIHGMGKGLLKQRIHEALSTHPEVLSFKNEHHPQFGFGATEIILRG